MLYVQNLTNAKTNRAIPNAFVIESYDDNGNNHYVVFQSYESTIIDVDYENRMIIIYPDYNYSNTTIKHRNYFFDSIAMGNLSTTKALEKALKNGCAECGIGNFTVKKISVNIIHFTTRHLKYSAFL